MATNCGFESGDFAPGWGYTGDFLTFVGVSPHPPPTGTPGSGLYGAFFGPVGVVGCISQMVMTPGSSYDISVLVANRDSPNEFQVWWDGTMISDSVDMATFDYRTMFWNNNPHAGEPHRIEVLFPQ